MARGEIQLLPFVLMETPVASVENITGVINAVFQCVGLFLLYVIKFLNFIYADLKAEGGISLEQLLLPVCYI